MKDTFSMEVVRHGSNATQTDKIEEVELEEALDLAGTGRFQYIHCALMFTTLLASLLEMIGIAYVLPAAACDLHIPDSLRGIITSIPNIGVIATAPFWGMAADSLGRRPVLLVSCAAAGIISFAASFMPNLTSFALCKLAGSLFLACPSSLGFAYASELVPRKNRDKAVLICNGLLMLFATFSAVFAWIILSTDWRYQLGGLMLRPWRLLTLVYAMPLLLAAAWMITAMESPKFLMTKGKHGDALKILGKIFAVNSGKPIEEYSVKALNSKSEEGIPKPNSPECELTAEKKRVSVLALLRPPHLKWLALTGFLMFSLFSVLNGLYLFAPDLINRAMRDTDKEGSICVLMNESQNKTSPTCEDSMSNDTFYILIVTTVVYGVLVNIASISPINKRTLLVGMFTIVGAGCLMAGLVTNRVAAGAAISALQLTAFGIGPLTAYAVHLFPTSLRGTAVGAVMMFGRVGSALGANVAGFLLASACSGTFYGFSLLLFFCSALCFLLPRDQRTNPTTASNNEDDCVSTRDHVL